MTNHHINFSGNQNNFFDPDPLCFTKYGKRADVMEQTICLP